MSSAPPTSPTGSLASGIFFIAGTAIGAGMLALPFVTGIAGFWPSFLVSFLCWLFMAATGLLFLEAVLWMPDGAHVLSITHRFLGSPGRTIGGVLFLFLYYSLMVAYFSAGVPIFIEIFSQLTFIQLPVWIAYPLFGLIFGGTVMAGTRVTDRLNFTLVIGMILAFVLLVGVGGREIDWHRLTYRNWRLSLFGLPTLIGAYGYHNIIPSISMYLRRDARKLRAAVLIGSAIPFVAYTIWQLVVLGVVLPMDLQQTLESGIPFTEPILGRVENPFLTAAAHYFSLFALVTSVLGVALAMVDFLGDGLKIPRRGLGRLLLCLCVFLPPLAFAWSVPGLFFTALSYAGGFGETILNALFPILIVWVGRYRMKLHSDTRLPGGRPVLLLLLLGVVVIVGEQFYQLIVH